MKILRNLPIYALAILLAGCTNLDTNLKIQASKQANPWTHLNLNNDPHNFQFAIVSDRTGHHRPGVFAQAVEKLNLLNPEFVISVGDLIEGGIEDENEIKRQWDEFDGLVNELHMPFFYVPGNHDISNKVMADVWQRRRGRSYYHFVYHNVLFLCLNTEDPPTRSISQAQSDYFRDVLDAKANVRWTLVIMHKPLSYGQKVENWLKLESLLANRSYTVIAGHEHTYDKSLRNGREYYLLAVTGAGNPTGLDECKFDHIVWVTMTDDGPVVANLLLEGILDDDPCP
ncbi:MAG: metallophosphoesterase family protein [Planctomycetota bacterium]|jgi:predicted phosphodiesterase